MNKTITQAFCAALFLGALAVTGCEDKASVIEAPQVSAEDIAEAEAKRAAYEKEMKESYGKGN